MKKVLLLFFLFSATFVSGQSEFFRKESAFSDHLFKNRLYSEGILYYRWHLRDTSLAMAQRDTLLYRLGYCFEKKGLLDSSVEAYSHVGNTTALYEKSSAAVLEQYIEASRFGNARNFMGAIAPRDAGQLSYKFYWMAATDFLNNDTAQLARDSLNFQFAKGDALTYTNAFRTQMGRIEKIRKKSPALAAGMSAVIPGLGKAYAGRPKHGLAAFMPCAVLGVQAFEAYRRGGVKDPRFLVYSSLFSVFYIGNIYGSALTVKAVRNETINDARYRIQADLVLSLRQFSR